eukprot:9486619-Pyramimonas_sp.AAC.1
MSASMPDHAVMVACIAQSTVPDQAISMLENYVFVSQVILKHLRRVRDSSIRLRQARRPLWRGVAVGCGRRIKGTGVGGGRWQDGGRERSRDAFGGGDGSPSYSSF